jgi:hypothetical protein
MKKHLRALSIAAGLIAASVSVGCTQMPTEKHGIADIRPQIAFKVDGERPHKVRQARVHVDGLDMGPVGDYIDGTASVRIVPGTHTLRVVSGDEVLMEEKFYVGDGVNRTFIIK